MGKTQSASIHVGSVQIHKRGKYWHCRYTTPTGRVKQSLQVTNQKLAIERAREIDARLQRRDWGGLQEHRRGPGTNLGDFLDEFKASYSGWGEETFYRNKWILDNIREEFGKVPITEIGVAMIQRWISKLNRKGLKPSSVNWNRAALSTIFNTAMEWGLVSHNPVRDTKQMRLPKRVPKALTTEQASRLLAHLADYARDAALLFLNTGMRKRDLFKLQWRDVNFETKLIAVRDPKSKKDYVVPMSDQAHELLQDFWRKRESQSSRRQHQYVICGSNGEPIQDIKKSLLRASRDAGIEPHVTHHVLRHTFATTLRGQGVPIVEIQELLGHSNIQTTMIYAAAMPDNLDQAVKSLPRIEPDAEEKARAEEMASERQAVKRRGKPGRKKREVGHATGPTSHSGSGEQLT